MHEQVEVHSSSLQSASHVHAISRSLFPSSKVLRRPGMWALRHSAHFGRVGWPAIAASGDGLTRVNVADLEMCGCEVVRCCRDERRMQWKVRDERAKNETIGKKKVD